MRAALISVALGYFFYLPRAALWCPLKALPFPLPPLGLAPSVHPRGTLGHSGMVMPPTTLSPCADS